jgi:starch binding protein with CBM20 domain
MKQLTFALWLKSTTDFSTQSGLVNVITAAFNGISHSNRRFSFTDYPPEYASDIQQLADLVSDGGFAIGEGSFISLIEFGFVRTYIANISLPAYGEGSFVRFIMYGNKPVAQQFDFNGPDFVSLTITANSPHRVFLTGSNSILRNWDPFNAVPLVFDGGAGGPLWTLTIPLLPGEILEFKLVYADGQYEPGPNRVYTAGNSDDQLYIDWSR